MRQTLKCGLMVLFLTGTCAMQCAGKNNPPDPKLLAIQNISVLPIVDARAGDKKKVNMEDVQRTVTSLLNKKKHYPASAASASGEVGQIAVEDLESAVPSYVKKLGPADARWVMVICLDDVMSKLRFGSTGNAELSGYLFDKDSGELVWKGKGVGQAGQGGLMGMAMKGAMTGQALLEAIQKLLKGMPNRPKPGK
jgi:hypothetical protein